MGLREAARALLPDSEVLAIESLGRGHIHATLRVCAQALGREPREFVFQRVNRHVFPDPLKLARNLERVTEHLGRVPRTRRSADPERRALRLLRSRDGRSFHRDAAGNLWRGFPFITGSSEVRAAPSPEQAAKLAGAFGGFLAGLDGLDSDRIETLLPGFHDLEGRLRALDEAARVDSRQRREAVADEIEQVRGLARRLLQAPSLAEGALPRRLVHNDCKLNNLLVDEHSGEPLCVVDLDTVMSGLVLFDFGELLRTAASDAPEDERHLERITLDLNRLGQLARGFVAGTRGLLEPVELQSLRLAGPRMAIENAVRFLTDHLEGDAYFPVDHPGHNLERARAQRALTERFLDAEPATRAIFDELESGGRNAGA